MRALSLTSYSNGLMGHLCPRSTQRPAKPLDDPRAVHMVGRLVVIVQQSGKVFTVYEFEA